MKNLNYLFLSLCLLSSSVVLADQPIPRSNLVTEKTAPNVYTDNSQTIAVSQDNPEFTIQLPANPTTGYSWFTKNYNDRLLTLEKQEYIAPPHDGKVGAGGTTLWHFKANSNAFKGSFISTIELIYARPWELNKEQPAKVIVFNVVTTPEKSN